MPVAVAATIIAWLGGSLVVLGDDDRELSLGLSVASLGLALGALSASGWNRTQGLEMAIALAAAGVASALARARRGLAGWGLLPSGSTPRLTLALVAGPVGAWIGWSALNSGPTAPVAIVLIFGAARLLTGRRRGVALTGAAMVMLAVVAGAWTFSIPSWAGTMGIAGAVLVSLLPNPPEAGVEIAKGSLRPTSQVGVLAAAAVLACAAVLLATVAAPMRSWSNVLVVPSPAGALTLAALAGILAVAALIPPGLRSGVVWPAALTVIGLGFVSTAPDLLVTALVVLYLACAQSSLPARFPGRLRWPSLGAVILVGAVLLSSARGDDVERRLLGLALSLAIPALVGLVPFLQEFDRGETLAGSSLLWMALVGPLVCLVVVVQERMLLVESAGPIHVAVLIAVGLVNVLWGLVGAARSESIDHAWRYSFLADWGLVLVGLGLLSADGLAAALLIWTWMLLGRLPLAIAATAEAPAQKAGVSEKGESDDGWGVAAAVLGMALLGSAPFAGFPARILLLRAASSLSWPLAAVLAVAYLGWVGHGFRLGRSLDWKDRRTQGAAALALVIGAGLGIFPASLLRVGGLG